MQLSFAPSRVKFLNRLALLLMAAAVALAPRMAAAQTAVLEEETQDADPGMAVKNIAVVALAGYDNVMADIDYLGALVGRPEGAQFIEGTIALFTQGQGLVGLDKSRPWGVVVQTDGSGFVPLVCLPVDDLDAVLRLAQAFGVQNADVGGGVTELTVPRSPAPLFVKKIDDWVYVAQKAELLDNAPADPTAALTRLVADYDIGATALLQNVPPIFKQVMLTAMRQGVEEGLEPLPGESEEAYQARREMTELQVQQLEQMMNQLDRLTIGLAINGDERSTTYLDIEITAVPGSETAAQMAIYDNLTTRFAGFIQEDQAVSMNLSVVTPPELLEQQRAQLTSQMETVRKQVAAAIENDEDLPSDEVRETVKLAVLDLIDALEATAMEGRFDMAGVIELSPNAVTAYAAAHIASPDKVEQALRRFEELAADKPQFPGVEWNFDAYNGVAMHRLSVPTPPEEPFRQMFGDSLDVVVGIGEETVYFAAGKDCVAKLTAAIDASAAAGETPVKPLQLTVSLKPILDTVATIDKTGNPVLAMLADMMQETVGTDHVRLMMEGVPNGARYRLEVEEDVLRALAQAIAQAAQKAAGGQQPPPF